jgi:hypothetical protein
MGSPISGIIAEIFLQSFEEKHLNHILDQNNIIFYTRYVDDILLIYNTDKTNPDHILKYMNSLHDDLVFTPTLENKHNSINFLDLLITRKTNSVDINIYRKPTTTNTTINYFPNHPMEQKLAAYRYMINRMSSLPLSPEQQNTEWQTILDIANSNNFPEHIVTKLRTTIQNPNKTSIDDSKQKKWTTFTYHSPKIRKVNNLFKHTNTKIAYRTSNTIAQRTRTANTTPTHDFEKSGIYKLECRTCHKAYVGQTNRTLNIRCREHI